MSTTHADDALEPLPDAHTLQTLRTQLHPHLHNEQALVLLDLGCDRCRLMISEGSTGHPQPVFHHLPLGLELLTKRSFKQRFPSALQLEQAIMLTEDAVMPLQRLIPPSNVLASRDTYIWELAALALPASALREPAQSTPILTREYVDRVFDMVVTQAQSTAAQSGRLSPLQAATAVLLREMLYHWPVGALQLLPLGSDRSACT